MDSSNMQYYKEQLIKYLRSTRSFRSVSEQDVQKVVSAIEVDLLDIICLRGYANLHVIYEFLDKDVLKELLNETNRGKSLNLRNEQSGGMLRNAINFYLGFLDSKNHPLSEQEKKGRKKRATQLPIPQETGTEIEVKTEVKEPETYDKLEGKKYETAVTRYERNQGNRKDCIAHYGYVCQVCEMNFEQIYGELGKNFIEVHHLYPVSQGERQVHPIEDLIPLCSNCHSMIHRQEDVSDWQGLKEQYLANKMK